ncbi:MAG: gliding motility-associated C-terminal domain-containing protein, partial [Paludibacter sp.]
TSTSNISVCSNSLPFVWNGKSCNATGTYTANFTNSAGCESVATLVLAVKTPSTSTTNISVCSNNLPFVWNGTSCNTAGTYTANFTNSVGCDSVATLVLAVKTPTTSTSNVSVCYNNLPYEWNGKSYTTAGTYTTNFTNSAGCDSVATLILALKTPTSSTSNVSVCTNNLPFVWNEKNYTNAGTYTANFTNSAGCDSVATLILAVKVPTTSTSNISVCSNSLPFVWNGKSYTAAGTYTANFINSAACDSVATLVLAVKTPTNSTTNISICSNNLPFVWNGKSCNAAGIYTANFTNSAGCDSVATLVLEVKTASTSIFNISVCSNNLPFVWNGISYSTAGTYTAKFTNSAGCDSIATLILAVKSSIISTTTASVCSNNLPFVWNGKSCNAAGTYTANFTNSAGCDSVATLVLAVKTPSTSISNISVCSNDLPYVWNGKSYNAAGSYTTNFSNAFGCDSVATLVLTVKAPSTSTITASVCSNNLPFVWNGKSYITAGTYTTNFINSAACDSVATLVLTVKVPTTSTTNISICANNLPYFWNGKNYTAAGTYTANIPNSAGCDSVATLVLALKQSSSSVTKVVTCPFTLPYFWNNNSYTAAGVYTAHFVNSVGCDSTATLMLDVKSPLTSTTVDYVCPSALPYFWNKNFYSETGTYSASFHTASGCDSVATLKLNVVSASSSVTKDAVSAAKLPYVWNKMAYTESGTYTSPINFINAVGCDSIATLILKVNLSTAASTTASVCPSELPYIWNGTAYYSAGTYTKTMTNVFGDNVVVTLELNILPVYNLSQSVSIFTGQTFSINGKVYGQPGEYTDILKTTAGCDSTVVTNLSFIKIPNTITPNGDGKNDVFMKDYHVKIYNRNGVKLFDGADGWDGTYNGKPVAKDTYFYVLLYTQGDIEKSDEGYIMVIR